jgi:hypothetical protein
MNNEMMKCGIINNCINDTLIYYSKLEKHRKKIIQNLRSLRKITDKQLSDLKITYKDFSKHFFSKKTINCMKSFCKPNPNNYEETKKNIDEMKLKIKASKTKFRLMGEKKNYVILMDVIFVILGHFCKNYQRFFQ